MAQLFSCFSFTIANSFLSAQWLCEAYNRMESSSKLNGFYIVDGITLSAFSLSLSLFLFLSLSLFGAFPVTRVCVADFLRCRNQLKFPDEKCAFVSMGKWKEEQNQLCVELYTAVCEKNIWNAELFSSWTSALADWRENKHAAAVQEPARKILWKKSSFPLELSQFSFRFSAMGETAKGYFMAAVVGKYPLQFSFLFRNKSFSRAHGGLRAEHVRWQVTLLAFQTVRAWFFLILIL